MSQAATGSIHLIAHAVHPDEAQVALTLFNDGTADIASIARRNRHGDITADGVSLVFLDARNAVLATVLLPAGPPSAGQASLLRPGESDTVFFLPADLAKQAHDSQSLLRFGVAHVRFETHYFGQTQRSNACSVSPRVNGLEWMVRCEQPSR